MKFKCVIVETRLISNLSEIIMNNHLEFLPSKYILHIFVSKKNKHLVDNFDFKRTTIISILENEIKSMKDNNLMTSIDFWKNLNCDKVLIFQSDSGLIKNNIEEFEEYDWVGAPWPDSGWSKGIPWIYGSNGGLSIRSVSKMIECIEKFKYNDTINEDAFFSINLFNMNSKVYREANYKFSVESDFRLGTTGYHAIDKWLTKEQCIEIRNQFK